jgi:hypothetical protein
MGGAWTLKRIELSFHYGLAGESSSDIPPARLMEVFMLANHFLPNPDKRDKYLHEMMFCQKLAENYFLGTKGNLKT